MAVVQSFTIDLLKPNYNYFRVVQQDSIRSISLYLYAGGATYNVASELGSGETLLTFVEYRRSDGVRRMYDTTSMGTPAVTQNATLKYLWTVALDADCFAVPGWTQINVRFETESGKRLHTFAIMAEVEETACSDNETNDWSGLNSIADLRTGVSNISGRMDAAEASITALEESTSESEADFENRITDLENDLAEIHEDYSMPPKALGANIGGYLMVDPNRNLSWINPLNIGFSGSIEGNVFTCSASYMDIEYAIDNGLPYSAYYLWDRSSSGVTDIIWLRCDFYSRSQDYILFSGTVTLTEAPNNPVKFVCQINTNNEVNIIMIR